MKSNLREITDKNNVLSKRITIINNTRIINGENKSIVIKKKSNNNLDKTYDYLKSRAFDYFPKKIDEEDGYDIYEYLNPVEEPDEQKASDIINLLVLLHSKTTYYKEIDYDDFKKIYEDIEGQINYLSNYYNDLINLIDREIYMSPSNYLIARNINLIFKTLKYCYDNINLWYDKIKNKKRVRVVNLHNNVKLEHFIKADKPYFISWDKTKKDNPIYDLLSFYQNHYLDFDFKELFLQYEAGYPLLEEERILLFILIVMPDKINIDDKEYDLCIKLSKFFDNLYKSYSLVTTYKKIKH